MNYRYDWADYYNLGTTGSPSWALMGTGFTSLDEKPGAQSESKIYINQRTASSSVKNYQTAFPFSADAVMTDGIVEDMYNIATRRATGDEARREYVRVELWREAGGADVFTARKFNVSVQVDSITGAGGQAVVIGGTLNALGDPEDGEFDVSAKTFTKK